MSIILFLQMGPGWLMSAACVAAGLRHKKLFFFFLLNVTVDRLRQ